MLSRGGGKWFIGRFVSRGLIIFLVMGCFLGAQAQERLATLTAVRTLDTCLPLWTGGPQFLSAASGMVIHQGMFYFVADDAQVLAYGRVGEKLKQVPLLVREELPTNSRLRGALKPDFEALTLLELGGKPYLLALCSGSGERRNSGVLLPLAKNGVPGCPREFDLTDVYEALRERFADLNIEGASVLGERLRLLQRANSLKGSNAAIDLHLASVVTAALKGGVVQASAIAKVQEVDLGSIKGPRGPVRWAFTDLCPMQGGRGLFTAAAEDTDNPYEDGEIVGSAVGVMELDGRVSWFGLVDRVVKLEGIARSKGKIFVVTDADDPHHPATLFLLDASNIHLP